MSRSAVNRGGALVDPPDPGQWIGPIARIVGAVVTSRLGRPRVLPFLATVNKDDLLVLKALIEAGKVRPVIDRTFPFDQVRDAVRYLETGQAQGKVVISVPGDGKPGEQVRNR